MAKSISERQDAYRERITSSHKRIEVILELEIYDKLVQLVKASRCKSRIEYMTGLIVREHKAVHQPLLANHEQPVTLPCNETAIDLWSGDRVRQCHAKTARGRRCQQKGTQLLIVDYRYRDKLYELLTCRRHHNNFHPHPAIFRTQQQLLYNVKQPVVLPKKEVAPSEPLHGNNRPEKPVIMWKDENRRCQAKTVRGERCRKSKNLLVITYRHQGTLYELVTCKQHNTELFAPYPGIFKKPR